MSTTKYREQRVGVFVDVQNMYYSAKNLYSAKVDFSEVLKAAVGKRKLLRAFAYVIKADVGAEKDFFEALNKIGYEVKEKELQVFYGGAKKGDWDVGICMDVIRLLPKIDVVVLVSGDGDYTELLKYAKSRGVKAEVIAFDQTASKHLTEEAEEMIDMSEEALKFLIGNPPKARKEMKKNGKNDKK
jgi:uncharacterized LabA/DUF88 family protein